MYRLAPQKKRSEKRHKCLWIQSTCVRGSRKGTARLSTVTHSATLPAVKVPSTVRLQVQQRCADCGFYCGCRSAVIVGSADWQRTDFFIQMSRCCDRNE